MYSIDLRWRGIFVLYVYGVDATTVSTVLGISDRSLSRWSFSSLQETCWRLNLMHVHHAGPCLCVRL